MDTPNLLNQNEFKRFSISWLDGRITVRSGDQRGHVIMEWLDPNPIGVSHIGVRTGWGAKGIWKLRFEQNLKYPSPFGSSDNQKSNLSCTLIFFFFSIYSFSFVLLEIIVRAKHFREIETNYICIRI